MRRIAASLIAVFCLTSCTSTEGPTEYAAASAPQPVASASNASLDLLNSLPVKGRAPKTGYARDKFRHWDDDVTVELGHNGCDTRNDILQRDLVEETFKPRTHNCVVLTGVLHDPYTGTDINFVRGPHSSDVQIDHVVSLSNAWQTGAQQLNDDQRRNFANDPLNLLAVSGPANQQKGDGDAATWLPANKKFRCDYVTRQVQVKAKYQLWVTAPEKEAISRILTNCG